MTTRLILMLGAAALGLAGCGGGSDGGDGGGGGGGSPVATRLTGTVATGAPMAKAQVEVKDKNNEKATAKVGDDGRYEVDIANMAAPFIAQAKGYVGGQPTTYYALLRAVPNSHVLNITQTTDAVARNAGIDSAEVFKTPAQLSDAEKVNFDNVKRVSERLASVLKDYFEAVGLKSASGETLDVTTTKFAADKVDPVDRLLECLSYDAATGTLTVKSFCSGAAAATTVDLQATTPAPLPAPNAETLDYVKTNGPLIDKMLQRLSDAWSGNSAAELRKVSEESLSDDVLDAWDGKGDDNSVDTREKRLDRRDELFEKEGRRLALATGNIVGADKSSRTIDMCITVAASSARDGETGIGIGLIGFTMHMNDSGAWQVADVFLDDRCGAPKIPKGKVRLQAIVVRSVHNHTGPNTPSIKATRITGGYRMCVGKVSDGLPFLGKKVPVDHEHCSEPNELERIIDVSDWKPGPTEPQVKLLVYFGKEKDGVLTVANAVSEKPSAVNAFTINAFAINAFGNVRHNDQEVCIEAPLESKESDPRSNSECKPAPGVQ